MGFPHLSRPPAPSLELWVQTFSCQKRPCGLGKFSFKKNWKINLKISKNGVNCSWGKLISPNLFFQNWGFQDPETETPLHFKHMSSSKEGNNERGTLKALRKLPHNGFSPKLMTSLQREQWEWKFEKNTESVDDRWLVTGEVSLR